MNTPNPTLEIEGVGNAICSVECLQDIEIQMRMFRQFRITDITEEEIAAWKEVYFGPPTTPPEEYDQSPECVTWREMLGCYGPWHRSPILTGEITTQEVEEWGAEYEKLKKINFEEVRKKYNVKFESDDQPYQECK